MSNYGDILNGVRKCDANSQMAFYDMYVGTVYKSAYAVAGDSAEAEEIVQDTMLKMFEKPEMLNDDAKAMERILRRVAVNAAIDVVRKRKGFIVSIDDSHIVDVAVDEDIDDYDFSVDEIKNGIAELPDVYRVMLTLRLFDEMSFADIAEMLKVNSSTARVQYTRGIEKLRNLLIERRKKR